MTYLELLNAITSVNSEKDARAEDTVMLTGK